MYGVLLLLAPCALGYDPSVPQAKPDVVLQWNETVLKAIRADNTPPPLAARNLAIVHAAIYDAVNAVTRTHRAYRVDLTAPEATSPEAAAAVAAHRVLVALYPKQVERFDAVLDRALATVADGAGKTTGIHLGRGVAERLLDWRREDGAQRRVTYKPSFAAGYWRPTPPGFRAALLPQWTMLTCFCMKSGSQFRPSAPPAMSSTEYAASYREVKSLGGVNSRVRTAEQTTIARFWSDDAGTVTPPGHWNRIAQTVALQRGTTLDENARLFALLNLALADAGIVAWDCKFKYNTWRPVQGIQAADPTVNAATLPDPEWMPLLTTPPFPTYTSGHSTFSGAAAAVLAKFFGTDEVRFSSTTEGLPGVTRTFKRFSEAADEAGKSRIYGGIHWEFDNSEGLACGRALGEYVADHFLLARAR